MLRLASLSLLALCASPVQEESSADRPESAAETPSSVFTQRVFLGDQPPETRTLAAIQVLYAGCTGAPRDLTRDLDATVAYALELREAILGGRDFGELARLYSKSKTAPTGGVVGTFAASILNPDFDGFLFSAEVGELSEPVVRPTGVYLLKRIESRAGIRVIRITDTGDAGREAVAEIQRRLAAGEAFEDLALELSEDPDSAPRGGALGTFERAAGDALIKLAAFEAELDEVVGPVVTPLGLYLVKRVDPDSIPPELHESQWIDVRCILLTHELAPAPLLASPRTVEETEEFAEELAIRIGAGEDMAALAELHTDDLSHARLRDGRVGWMHRFQPGIPNYLDPLWLSEPGELIGPIPVPFGQVLAMRLR